MKHDVQVSYIHHSGYLVRDENRLYIFDYYSDPAAAGQRESNLTFVQEAAKDPRVERLLVFVSHNHHDHFDPDIFQFRRFGKPVTYICSSDVKTGQLSQDDLVMEEGRQASVGPVTIRAFGSTDAGLSFLVRTPHLSLFHAGDLNWWCWYDESTAEELAEYERSFKTIITELEAEEIDVAFFPVDPRLKDYYHVGGEYFLEKIRPRFFFPMHFAYNYQTSTRFHRQTEKVCPDCQVICIDKIHQVFPLSW